MKFAISYSFGKDSALALWRMVRQGHQPVCLITTYNEEAGRSWFHGVDGELMDALAQSLGLPLLRCTCRGEEYHLRMEEALAAAKKMGAEACVFGDIDIEGHREWNEARCQAAGLECRLPLWQMGREAAVRECLAEGFLPLVKCVQNPYRPLLGKALDEDALAFLREKGADLCGENGEYHTIVRGGPLFRHPVPVTVGEPIDLGTHSVVDIRLVNTAQGEQA